MNIVYMGSGEIGVPTLRYLITNPAHELTGIFTQPDKPAGRKQILTPPPTKEVALEYGIPVFQPPRIREEEAVATLRRIEPEIIVVMAYGQILPREVIAIPSVACINLHASLLPAHRGASPVQASIREGDTETGITVMHIDEGLDTGDILCARSIAIRPGDTGRTLHDRLADLAPRALEAALAALVTDHPPRTPQDTEAATHAPKLCREDGLLDWTMSAAELERTIRAYDPWPGTFTRWRQGDDRAISLKIFPGVTAVPHPPGVDSVATPGTVLEAGEEGLLVAARGSALRIPELQPEGGRRMATADFLRGHPVTAGERLF